MSAEGRARRRPLGRGQWLAVLITAMFAVLVVDLAVPSLDTHPLLILPLLLGSLRLGPRPTAGLAALAGSMALLSGAASHSLADPSDWLWIFTLVLVGVLSVLLSGARSKAIAAKEASDTRDRLISEISSEVSMLTDGQLRIDWASPSAERTLGWPPVQLQGREATDFIHPDDLVEFIAGTMDAGFRGGSIHEGGLRTRCRWRRGDTSYRWLEVMAKPVPGGDDSRATWLLQFRDIQAETRVMHAMAADRRLYQLLEENSSDVVYSAGLDQRITWISPAVSQSLEWWPAELVGTKVADLIHPEDEIATQATLDRILSGREVENPVGGFLVRMRTRSGEYRWMSSQTRRVRDEHHRATGVIGSLTPADDLVAARTRADEEEHRLQALVDGMLDPFVLLTAVRAPGGQVIDFTFEDANPAALDAYEVSRDELIGRRLNEFNPATKPSGLFALFEACVERGEPVILDDWAYPPELVHDRNLRYDVRAVKVGDSVSETWRDVTERNEAAERIAESEERFRLLAQNSSDVVVQERGGVITWVSPALTQVLGWPIEEWTGRGFEDFVHPDDVAPVRALRSEIEGGATRVVRMRIRARLGAHHWIELHAGPFTNGRGERDGLVGSFRIIDAEVAAQASLERQARFDDLTGALKRDHALARLHDIAGNPRTPGKATGVLFVDLDNFKSINDAWGHVAGDAVLKAVSDRTRASIRAADIMARMGGDEFLVVLEGVHDLADAIAVAEKIRARCAEPVATPEGAIAVTLSIGVTLIHPIETGDAIVARADRAMYVAKKEGRNRVIPIDPDAR